MTQQVVHVRVSLPDTATQEDTSSQSYTVEATGSDPNVDFGQLDIFFADIYNNVLGAMSTYLARYLSNNLDRSAGAVKVVYTDITGHLDGSAAGPPVHTSAFTLAAPATANALPAEVAMVVTYRAGYGTDLERGPVSSSLPSSESAIDQGAPTTHSGVTRPRARDRGRIYHGPFNLNTINAAGAPTPTFKADLGFWANDVFGVQLFGAHNQFQCQVWSRRKASVAQPLWWAVDDSWSSQRRRGDTAAARVHTYNPVGGSVL